MPARCHCIVHMQVGPRLGTCKTRLPTNQGSTATFELAIGKVRPTARHGIQRNLRQLMSPTLWFQILHLLTVDNIQSSLGRLKTLFGTDEPLHSIYRSQCIVVCVLTSRSKHNACAISDIPDIPDLPPFALGTGRAERVLWKEIIESIEQV